MSSIWFLALLPIVYIAGVGMGWQWRGVADRMMRDRQKADDLMSARDWHDREGQPSAAEMHARRRPF